MNPFPTDIFTEPGDVDSDTLANLGPWSGGATRPFDHHDQNTPRRIAPAKPNPLKVIPGGREAGLTGASGTVSKEDPMPDWTKPMEGGCRCDRVRIRVSAPPVFTVACHCAGCQKMSSSAYSLSMAVPEPAFEVIAGETVLGGLQGEAVHHFCGFCKTWMFSRVAQLAGLVNLRPTMLDDHSWFAPFLDTCAASRLPWAETGAAHSYPEFPGPEEVGPLIAEFAAWLKARG